MEINLIWLDEVGSTSTYLSQQLNDSMPSGTVVAARSQTAGRGQRGNTWEAEPGKNLSFSLLLRPTDIEARSQFRISQAVALGIAGTLGELLQGHDVRIKWPNDIYAGNRKICGILIENSLSGQKISHSIAGIGINVNQTRFVSDAPNPVSIAQLTGRETELEPLLLKVVENIAHELETDPTVLHERYMDRLWSKERMHYRDTASGREFEAAITGIGPLGHMELTEPDGSRHTYAFKEVAVVLPQL